MALFEEDFVRTISRLRISAKRVPRGGTHAEQRSIEAGGGMEFRDYRSYIPGDDFRRIDWNFYRRSGRLFLRLFEELRDLPVYVLLDVSDSMFFETPPRADPARQMAAAMVAAALNQHDRPQIHPFGSELAMPLRSVVGRAGLMRAMDYLERLRPAGPTDLAASLRRFGSQSLRRGLVVVISDFFDPAGIDAVTDALRSLRHRLLLVQVSRREDAEPRLDGQLRLIDCEDGRQVDVTIAPDTLDRYRRAYRTFQESLQGFIARRRAGYLALDADRPVVDQLRSIFLHGVFVAGGE